MEVRRDYAILESISARTLADMDNAVANYKSDAVSEAVDLSDFGKKSLLINKFNNIIWCAI